MPWPNTRGSWLAIAVFALLSCSAGPAPKPSTSTTSIRPIATVAAPVASIAPAATAVAEVVPVEDPRFDELDAAVARSLAAGSAPGAVVVVIDHGEVVHTKAYGLRNKVPGPEPMLRDTVFDLASLTKPIATATAILMLIDAGRLHLGDRVAQYFRSSRR
jgi:CubicO group peptidase (beta-lactamase class C family)